MCKPMHHTTTSSDELYIPDDAFIQNIPQEIGEGSDEKRDNRCLEAATLIGKGTFLAMMIILIVMIIWLPWFYFELRHQRLQIKELHQQIVGELGRQGT